MTPRKKTDGTGSIEDALRRLEEIAELLHEGSIPLEESLKLYEEGLTLTQTCAERLQNASLTVKRLEKGFESTMKGIQEQRDHE